MSDQFIRFIGFAVPLTQHCSDVKSRLMSDNSTVDSTRQQPSSCETQVLQTSQIQLIENLKNILSDFKGLEKVAVELR